MLSLVGQEPGENMPIARIEFDEARELADLASITQDLHFVLEAFKRLREMPDEPEPILARAYWHASLVAYARCFATGQRSGLPEDIFNGLEGAIDVHRYLIEMRNKHAAHSVNPFERAEVGAVLSPPDALSPTIEGVASAVLQHISPGDNEVRQLELFVRALTIRAVAVREGLEWVCQKRAEHLEIGALYNTAEKVPFRFHAASSHEVSRPRSH